MAVSVLAWDIYAPETLSHACHRYMEHPVSRFMLIGAIGATAAHLTGLLPEQYDPYYLVRLEREDGRTH